MRAVRNLWVVAVLIGVAPTLVLAKAQTAADILREYRPSQPGVEYDVITDKAALEACKIESATNAEGKKIGFAIRDGQGKLLRRFVDTNGLVDPKGKTHIDQWSYYQNGFEVYREIDTDEDNHLDEIRWMNTGGTRTAIVKAGKIVGWKRISAEEASRVLVQAIITGNVDLMETVIASPTELQAVGAPKSLVTKATSDATSRVAEVEKLQSNLTGWKKNTVWQRFDGTMPHVIPAEAGLKSDLLLYENAFIFAGSSDGKENPMNLAYLQVPEIIRVGETWKFVELPRAIDPKKPAVAVADSGFRAALYQETKAPEEDAGLAAALRDLGEYDQKHAPVGEVNKKDVAEYHHGRIEKLHKILTLKLTDDQLTLYKKQVADSLAAAYQTGMFEKGGEILDQYAAKGDKVAAYAAYRKIGAQYALDADQPGNELPAQKNYLAALEGFLDKYPNAEESPDVMLNVATGREFNAEEKEARVFYGRLVKDFPDTPAGRKAAGALKRLDLVGKKINLAGTGLDGKPVTSASFAGKPLLITFWTTNAEPVRRDLPELKKVYDKYSKNGLAIVGVNLDDSRATLDAFLKDNPMPWAQIHEQGGMDSRLADEYGIISQPTMFLVDATGTVVNRSIHSAAELDRFLGKLLGENAGKLSLGKP